jgi:hypothetical protein
MSLGESTLQRLVEPVLLTPGDEDRLVGIAHHLVAAHVPDEEAAVGEGELELGRVPGRAERHRGAGANVLHQPDREVEEAHPLGFLAPTGELFGFSEGQLGHAPILGTTSGREATGDNAFSCARARSAGF